MISAEPLEIKNLLQCETDLRQLSLATVKKTTNKESLKLCGRNTLIQRLAGKSENVSAQIFQSFDSHHGSK